jgi:hypothetical protein
MKFNFQKIFATFVSSAVVCTLSYGAAKQPFGVLVNNRFQIEHFSKNGRDLHINCQFWNQSDDPNHLRPSVVIRGIQRWDGNFFPNVKLAVARTENGPWTSIDAKMPDGKKMQVVVPVTIRVVPLSVDCAPFVAQLGKMRWAKIALPSGDSIVVYLKQVSLSGCHSEQSRGISDYFCRGVLVSTEAFRCLDAAPHDKRIVEALGLKRLFNLNSAFENKRRYNVVVSFSRKRASKSPPLCFRQQARQAMARRIFRTRRNSCRQFGQR